MPELPEVETIARGLRPSLIGRKIIDATVYLAKTPEGEWAEKSTFEAAVTGRVIKDVRRRGKLLIIYFQEKYFQEEYFQEEQRRGSSGVTGITGMAFHLKMTGRLFTYDEHAQAHKHTRVAFRLQNTAGPQFHDGARGTTEAQGKEQASVSEQSQLFFDDARTFGYVRLFSRESLKHWSFWTQLGPEPLGISVDDFCHRMQGRRGMKALLLDQHIIAGVGNIYADEALFSAGIHPNTKGHDVPRAKLVRLHAALQAVLLQSIAECGSSIRDYRDAHGNAGAFQNNFRVYGRSGQTCVACQTPLATAKIAGRTTVFCEHCQR